jgi:hypothetical protein
MNSREKEIRDALADLPPEIAEALHGKAKLLEELSSKFLKLQMRACEEKNLPIHEILMVIFGTIIIYLDVTEKIIQDKSHNIPMMGASEQVLHMLIGVRDKMRTLEQAANRVSMG